jgi:arylsulfatase A-like enzyme
MCRVELSCRSRVSAIARFGVAGVVVWITVTLTAENLCRADAADAEVRRPNVVFILADDLGWSDLGCYGGEIATPHLDQLAENGLRYTHFYSTARCWPSRAALLAGYYAQQVRRDTVPGIRSGGAGVRPEWAPLLPAMLKQRGYRSYHSGKWHMDGRPLETGFDRSYWLQDQGRFFNPRVHYRDDEPLDPVPLGTDFYGTIAIADHAIACLKEHAERFGDRPFFHYVAFTAPHFPLHALPEDIERYRGSYSAGWSAIRAERFQRQQLLGLVRSPLSELEGDLGPPYHFPEALERLGEGEVNRPLAWDQLNQEQQTFQAMKMELHAAMIDRMDRETGRILDQLKAMDVYDDTLIFFASDNGASAEIMVRDDGHDPRAEPGSAATYLCLGPGFSSAANTPLRRHKTWVHEGGIASPLVVHWPRRISARGELRHDPGHLIDIVPTLLELTGIDDSDPASQEATPAKPGMSLVSTFAEDGVLPERELWWLHEGNRAVRVGKWKLVAARDEPWELYDLESDRAETKDLAAEQPERVAELARLWEDRWQTWVDNAGGSNP